MKYTDLNVVIELLLISLIGLGIGYLLTRFIDFLAFICEYVAAGVV
jgi:hypothetical protein